MTTRLNNQEVDDSDRRSSLAVLFMGWRIAIPRCGTSRGAISVAAATVLLGSGIGTLITILICRRIRQRREIPLLEGILPCYFASEKGMLCLLG